MTLHNYILSTLLAHTQPESRTARSNAASRWFVENIDSSGLEKLSGGGYCDPDHTCSCDACDGVFDGREFTLTTVNTGRCATTEEWCSDCVESGAFFCDRSEEYFSDRRFNSINVEGETVCYEYNQDELYHWDSDDEYHWESEPEEEEESDGLAGYHDSDRPWERKDFRSALVFGVELELKARNTRVEIAEIAEAHNLLAEEDPSLDDTYGIEIIGPPLPFQDYLSEDSVWTSFLEDVAGKASGWDAGTGYGLHVSINRGAISDFHTGKMLVFVNENQGLCENVAGRSSAQWAAYKSKKLTSGRVEKSEKYEALALRSRKRLEFRIFRSTLRLSGFLRAVEFTASIVEFTRGASARCLTESDYRTWLAAHASTYRNLAEHLGIPVPVKVRPATLK